MDNVQEKYIIQENYHGDIKYILADKPKPTPTLDTTPNRKKVDLSKPTDATIKPIVNLDLAPKRLNGDKPVCLTKPRDLNRNIPTPKVDTTVQSVPVKSSYRHVTKYTSELLRAKVKGVFIFELILSGLLALSLGSINWLPIGMMTLVVGLSPVYVIWFLIEIIRYKLKAKRDVWGDYSECIEFATIMEVIFLTVVILVLLVADMLL